MLDRGITLFNIEQDAVCRQHSIPTSKDIGSQDRHCIQRAFPFQSGHGTLVYQTCLRGVKDDPRHDHLLGQFADDAIQGYLTETIYLRLWFARLQHGLYLRHFKHIRAVSATQEGVDHPVQELEDAVQCKQEQACMYPKAVVLVRVQRRQSADDLFLGPQLVELALAVAQDFVVVDARIVDIAGGCSGVLRVETVGCDWDLGKVEGVQCGILEIGAVVARVTVFVVEQVGLFAVAVNATSIMLDEADLCALRQIEQPQCLGYITTHRVLNHPSGT